MPLGALVNGLAAAFWLLSAIAWWMGSMRFIDNIDTGGQQLEQASRRNRIAASLAFIASLIQAFATAGPAFGWWA
jgi:hypothetical protein